jgi:hypothetical protein
MELGKGSRSSASGAVKLGSDAPPVAIDNDD